MLVRVYSSQRKGPYDLALVFLLLRLRRLTLFFLHLALILETVEVLSLDNVSFVRSPNDRSEVARRTYSVFREKGW